MKAEIEESQKIYFEQRKIILIRTLVDEEIKIRVIDGFKVS
jgi:hypothetical protein